MRPVLLASLLLVALASPAFAEGGFYEVDGVEYYMAVGTHGSGSYSNGPDFVGNASMPFDGCVVAKLRPDTDHGRVQLTSVLHGVPVRVDLIEFRDPPGEPQGGVAKDLRVDGGRTHDTVQHPAVHADVVAWGDAVLEVAGGPYADPYDGSTTFNATFFVTDQGFRDDLSGGVLRPDGGVYSPGDPARTSDGDLEAHLRIESKTLGNSGPYTEDFYVPDGPELYIPPSEDYQAYYAFPNLRYGANGTLEIRTDSPFVAYDVDMTFTFRSPTGKVLYVLEWNDGPLTEFGQAPEGEVTVPLDQFGTYSLEVTGSSATPFAYRVTFQQGSAPPLDLQLHWEDVALGSFAPDAQTTCEEAVSFGPEAVSQAIFPRPQPPAFPVTVVVLTTLGVAAAVLVSIKMVVMVRAVRHPAEHRTRG